MSTVLSLPQAPWPRGQNPHEVDGVRLHTGVGGHFPSLSAHVRAGAGEAWRDWSLRFVKDRKPGIRNLDRQSLLWRLLT